MRTLPTGLIFDIAGDAELELLGTGAKRKLCCPFHDDHSPSAFVSADNVFYCSVCTPSLGWTAKRFCAELDIDWSRYVANGTASPIRPVQRPRPVPPPAPTFTAADAALTWKLARARARDDDRVDQDRPVYEYLAKRHLMESWELGAFGVLGPGMELPEAVRGWPGSGYRLLAPLYDSTGALANVQARVIIPRERRVMFPTGSVAKGTVFVCARGLEVLRGSWTGRRTVLYAEGLTDYLGLTFTSPVPVLASPGSGIAADGIGSWVHGYDLVLALDWDQAGENAIDPTAQAAFRLGASSIRRLEWPAAANDACDALERIGARELEQTLARVLGGGAA